VQLLPPNKSIRKSLSTPLDQRQTVEPLYLQFPFIDTELNKQNYIVIELLCTHWALFHGNHKVQNLPAINLKHIKKVTSKLSLRLLQKKKVNLIATLVQFLSNRGT
jgi:hypothetical protein